MTVLVLGGALLAALLFLALLRADPASLARVLREGPPVVLGAIGVVLLMLGQAGLGGMVLAAALAWLALRGRRRRGATRAIPHWPQARTAALEVEVELGTGAVDGLVLAGRHDGKRLSQLSLRQLLAMRRELGSDPDSVRLLEAYLDGRFAAWREDAETDDRVRQRVAPRPGAMTKQQAYEVLGLEPGAVAADVREAHRRLLKGLDARVGDTSLRAARIHEAKNVLLSDHD